MNTCEITQNEQGTFDLYINGQFIRSYTRKADAKRGFSRYVAASVCDGVAANSRQAVADTQAQNAPASNTGGQNGVIRETADKGSNAKKSTLRAHSTKTSQFVMVNGKLKEIPLRQGNETAAHIDTLTFTFTQDVLVEPDLPIDDQHPDNIRQLAALEATGILTSSQAMTLRDAYRKLRAEAHHRQLNDRDKRVPAAPWQALRDNVCAIWRDIFAIG